MVDPKKRRPRKHHRLNVWMNGEWVGIWEVAERKPARFQYAESWVVSSHARVLSLSLPFLPGNRPHEGAVVENYFDNLLPDNKEIRERLRRKFSVGSARAFDLLAEIGRDCVGAVQLLPEDEEPQGWNQILAKPLTEHDVETALKGAVTNGMADLDDDDFRISIAGAQEKTALLFHEGSWHKPLGSTPTTHILKLPLGLVGNMRADLRTSVENEWMCSKIIEGFGLDVAHCDIGVFGEEKALIVNRFDRKLAASGDYWLRLPQEDMCQAMGISPSLKYEADGGPGIESILELLRGSSQHERDRQAFFKTQILFWMLAATDGHAKNFSIYHERLGTYRMTPLYDILSAWPIIGTGAQQLAWKKAKLAMAFRSKNAHYELAKIQRRHFNVVAKECGIGENAEEMIQEILAETPIVIEKVQVQLPETFPPEVSQTILAGLGKSAETLASMPPD